MEDVLKCAMDIGEQMIICGAEVHRVEDTLKRICTAKGAKRVDAFIITSCMVVSVSDINGKTLTQTRRINGLGNDIERLHLLNDLSRRICSEDMTTDEITAEYNKILKKKPYPFALKCLSYSIISSSFAVFFGGGLMDATVAFFIGLILSFIVSLTDHYSVNKTFSKFLASFCASALAFISCGFGIITGVDKVMIGVIMTLIPGIGLTNAIRDLFTGDSITAVLRSIEAVLYALSIAAGYVVATFIFGGLV